MRTCCSLAAAVAVALLLSAAPARAQFKVKGTPPFDTPEKLSAALNALGQKDLAGAIEDLKAGTDHMVAGEFHTSEACFRRALVVLEKRFPGTVVPGSVHLLLGAIYLNLGDPGRTEEHLKEHLKTARNVPKELTIPEEDINFQYGAGLSLMASVLERRGDYAGAERYVREAQALWEKQYTKEKYPRGHFALVRPRVALAKLAFVRGDYENGEKLANQAFEMFAALADGKTEQEIPDPVGLAEALQILAAIRFMRDTPEDRATAEQLFDQSIAIMKQVFPKGHPHVARAIQARTVADLGSTDPERLIRRVTEAREMLEKSFPIAHPDLCVLIREQGYAWAMANKPAEAEKFTREALAMADALYPAARVPDGHPVLALCLVQAGYLALRKPGGADEAARLFREAARLTVRHTNGQAQLLSEVDTLNLLRIDLPRALDGLLSATAAGPFDPRDYAFVWASKGAAFRALERRHRALRASADAEAQALATKLESVRARLNARLLAPVGAVVTAGPDAAQLSAEKEALERKLNARLGLSAPAADEHPFDLAKALPAGAAFVDYVRYNRVPVAPAEAILAVPGLTIPSKDEHYAAFVLASGKRPRRVELGSAERIDKAVASWRAAIAAPYGKADERGPAREVGRLLWDKVAAELPAETSTVYLAVDGPLTRVPFVALPGRGPGTVLLEELTVVAIPNGPYLLNKLKNPPAARAGKGRMLVVGGVDYGAAGVPGAGKRPPAAPLPGTATEAVLVEKLARDTGRADPVTLTGAAATTAAVLDELTKARFAHVATHGFFAGRGAGKGFGLDPLAFAAGPRDLRTAGARNPLVLSGLMLAGANRADDSGLLTAEVIAGRRLAEMDLAVLSACETGLGEEFGGEGALGLQRVFHLTGCRTVVTSLWQVDDETTRDLMSRFYKHLWSGPGVTPASALRSAQLEVYRELRRGGDRRPRVPVVSATPATPPPAGKPAHYFDADTSAWAAFVASGVP